MGWLGVLSRCSGTIGGGGGAVPEVSAQILQGWDWLVVGSPERNIVCQD